MQRSLRIRLCVTCSTLLAPGTAACTTCGGGDLECVSSSGFGAIVSSMVIHVEPGFVPYTIAIVELDDGPWLYALIEGEVPVLRGQRVRVKFQWLQCGERFPVFVVL